MAEEHANVKMAKQQKIITYSKFETVQRTFSLSFARLFNEQTANMVMEYFLIGKAEARQ